MWTGYQPWADTVRACRDEFVRVARSFWLVPEIIPPLDRDDVSLLYCLCRHLDDAVDEAPSLDHARAALDQFREELQGRAPPRPLIAAFLAGAARTGMPLACTADLLDGMESDLGSVRIADDAALVRYAYRVAASVGLMLAPLLGMRGEEAEHRIVDLAIALQIGNVLLGVADDARRDRIYLPATRLAAAGLTEQDVLRGDARVLPVLQGLAAFADGFYQSYEAAAALVPLRYRHGVLLLGRIYGELGWRAARGEPVRVAPAALPIEVKAVRLVQLFIAAWNPRTLGLTPIPKHDRALHRPIAGWRGADA